jgi:hypothetical protein
MAMTMSISTSDTSTLRGYHLHVVLNDFYSSHNIRAITLQIREMWAHRILPSAYSSVSPYVVLPLWLWEDVRVYLICYILYIINWYICGYIFGRIDIVYYRLPYVSWDVLPLETLILYIPVERHNTIHLIIIYNLFFLQQYLTCGKATNSSFGT